MHAGPLTDEELQRLVFLAKDGDEQAKILLLQLFGWRETGPWNSFLGKYFNLLWYGRFDFQNKESKRFISLYIKRPDIRRLLKFSAISYRTVWHTLDMINYLQTSIRKEYDDEEELKQDLVMLFLSSLDRYEKVKKIRFTGYLMGTFRFTVKDFLVKRVFAFDMSRFKEEHVEDEIPVEDTYYLPDGPSNRLRELEDKSDTPGIFWINGQCSPLFQSLSIIQRKILVEQFIYKKTALEIAHQLGMHRNTVRNIRERAIAKLESELKKERPSE